MELGLRTKDRRQRRFPNFFSSGWWENLRDFLQNSKNTSCCWGQTLNPLAAFERKPTTMPDTATSMSVEEESKKQKPGNISISTTNSTKPVSSSSWLLHTVLLYVAILGLGAIVGYTCFSSIYSHRCSDMIDEIERKCAQTSEHLSNQLKDARLLEQHLERTSATVDEPVMVELRGRLSKQESLIEHFEKREKKDTDTLIQLTYQNEKYKEMLTELQENVLEIQSKLNFETAEKESLQQQLQEAVEVIKVAETETSSAHVRLLHSSLILEV